MGKMGWEVPVHSTIEISAWLRFLWYLFMSASHVSSFPCNIMPHAVRSFLSPQWETPPFWVGHSQKLTYTKHHQTTPLCTPTPLPKTWSLHLSWPCALRSWHPHPRTAASVVRRSSLLHPTPARQSFEGFKNTYMATQQRPKVCR